MAHLEARKCERSHIHTSYRDISKPDIQEERDVPAIYFGILRTTRFPNLFNDERNQRRNFSPCMHMPFALLLPEWIPFLECCFFLPGRNEIGQSNNSRFIVYPIWANMYPTFCERGKAKRLEAAFLSSRSFGLRVPPYYLWITDVKVEMKIVFSSSSSFFSRSMRLLFFPYFRPFQSPEGKARSCFKFR